MSPFFYYPRGLTNFSSATSRFDSPPSAVGTVPRSRLVPLAASLGMGASHSACENLITRTGSISINLGRDGVRQVITGRRIWPTSIYPSFKNGRSVVCEHANELLFAAQCEIDAGVVAYASQPALFIGLVDGIKFEYSVDFVRNLANGIVEFVEVKANRDYLLKPGYQQKLDAVSEICRSVGWKFRVVFGEDLRRRNFFNFHAWQIGRFRFYRVPPSVEFAVVDRLSGSSDVALGDLMSLAGSEAVGRAAICALVCRSTINLNLSRRISADTPVTLVGRRLG